MVGNSRRNKPSKKLGKMSVVTLQPGTMKLTQHGKSMVAHAMFHRGKQFIQGAILLDREDAYHYVVLHLFCQGLEIILKGLLLLRNYDLYEPQLKNIRHNLIKAAEKVRVEFGSKPLREDIMDQLKKLNNLYGRQLLRYGSSLDIFIDPKQIPSNLIFKKTIQLIMIGNRILRKNT
jgi:hypothetical protein